MHRGSLGLCLALVARAAVAQEVAVLPPAPVITLEEALRRATAAQPAVIQAQGDLNAASAAKRAALGNWLPTLSMNGTGTRSFQEGEDRVDLTTGQRVPGDVSTTNASSGLQARWDVFTGFSRGAQSRAAGASYDAAEASLIDAEAQVTLETTQEFLNALAAAQLVRVRQASLGRAEEQLKVSVAKLRTGSATRSDSLRSLVQVGEAQVGVLQALAEQAQAEANLARLVGLPGRLAAADDSSFYRIVTAIDTAALRTAAEARSPRVAAAEANAEVARANHSVSKATYWPTLSLSGNLGYSGGAPSGDPLHLNHSRSVSLQGSWNIFNGFDREATIAVRAAAADAAEAAASDTRRQVAAALIGYVADLQAARLQTDITRTSLQAAEEDLRVQQERYRLGAATILDVLTSQVTLNEAEVAAVNARFAYLTAKAQIEALIGRPL